MSNDPHQTENVGTFYTKVWPEYVRWWHAEKTLGLHYAYYDDSTKSFPEAIQKMNEIAGQLLDLHQTQKQHHILDAGCGVGGTALYLADNYPSTKITGITICSDQVTLAQRYAKEKQIDNVTFMLQDYLHTSFSSEIFDGILALESLNHTDDYPQFIQEMYRILKPQGKLVIIDLFQNNQIEFNPVMEKIYVSICQDRGYAHPIIFNKFINHLEKNRFKIHTINDLTPNVIRSQFRSFTIGIPFFISKFIKRNVLVPLKILKNEVDHTFATAVPMALLGFKGVGSYKAIIAIKK
jgi:cyclopropane fatty-acyl-phospholipid synthase-like methyltransferase